ncbi:protein translocase subunit SecD [Gehongia tenuis]|uniref:Protein translocase subunit SecD n=1 Tax=Gehongia tenuis TaxID=2763655 RepID=A0A926D641_9FIRM|nr:protein translocase subunit SecD [Gehongia tenuis]MBC8531075.1 protein translocase subunit SecD [Gehongia tenuis]
MNKKSLVKLLIIFVLLIGLGYLAICGAQVGKYILKPLTDAIPKGLDLTGGVSALYQAVDPDQEDFESKMQSVSAVLRNRLDANGFLEATISRQGTDRIRVEIPNVNDPDELLSIIGKPAKLEFVDPNGEVLMDGSMVKTAQAAMGNGNTYVVAFELNEEGTDIFARATQEFLNQVIKINLDGTTISAPTVNSVIASGTGQIEGSFTASQAQQLASLIQSGALPLDLNQLEVRTISATLGDEAMSSSMVAGIIAIAFIFVFMIAVYRLPGLIGGVAMLWFSLLYLFFMAVIPGVQLTLPGVAGVVLSIGMAVDANVIIFERMKEELYMGKTLRGSVNSGFHKAFSAILDGNITTIIAGVVILFFGTGTIKGFAISLIIGICVSMFTAIVFTRYMLTLVMDLNVRNKRLYGLRGADK